MMRPDGVKVAEMPQMNVLGPHDPPFVTAMRQLLLPDAPEPAYAGQVIWRLDVRKPDELKRYTMMLGRSTRLGLVPKAPAAPI